MLHKHIFQIHIHTTQRSKEVHLKCYIHSYYLNFGHVEKQKVFVQSKTLIKSYKAIFS